MQKQQLQFIDKHITDWFQHLDDIIPNLIKNMVTETKETRFDLVTNVDKQIQNDFEAYLEKYFPTHQLLAEEKNNDGIEPYQGHLWIMDPIDGTANLVKQQEDYCIILAYFENGQPKLSYIYDYAHKIIYKAIEGKGAFMNNVKLESPEVLSLKDTIVSFGSEYVNEKLSKALYQSSFSVRYIGACGLDSVRVIKGQFGAHFNTNPKPWDIAAQFLFARELGLVMTQMDGQHLDFAKGGPFIISNKGCYEEILAIINDKH